MLRSIAMALLLVGPVWVAGTADRSFDAPVGDEVRAFGECPQPIPDDGSDEPSSEEPTEPDAARTPRAMPDALRVVTGHLRWPDQPVPESRALPVTVPPPIA